MLSFYVIAVSFFCEKSIVHIIHIRGDGFIGQVFCVLKTLEGVSKFVGIERGTNRRGHNLHQFFKFGRIVYYVALVDILEIDRFIKVFKECGFLTPLLPSILYGECRQWTSLCAVACRADGIDLSGRYPVHEPERSWIWIYWQIQSQ